MKKMTMLAILVLFSSGNSLGQHSSDVAKQYPFSQLARPGSFFPDNYYLQKNQISSLSSTIEPAWVAHYDPRNFPSYGQAAAIAMDDAGNVYVTGSSSKSLSAVDILTIKYNTAGKEVWQARYDGGSGDDEAVAIETDGSGNVWVTGLSKGPGTETDYVTVHYNAFGIQQWAMRYDGPGHYMDEPVDIAVDMEGNAYVTGASYGASGNDIDYGTVKYDASGIEQWVARYDLENSWDRPAGLGVDSQGNVYVTGASNDDYTTIKYNASGAEQWVVTYAGSENPWDSDEATALTIDVLGNVYVTGASYGASGMDYTTVKYNSSGEEQWVARYDNPGGDDRATAIAVDDAGNVYVTGLMLWDYGTATDYGTIKYNASGEEQWDVRYASPGTLYDIATGMVVDSQGNVYVTGHNYEDCATVKYNAEGRRQWIAPHIGGQATALTVDNAGNVFVAGQSSGAYTTFNYDAAGVEQWVVSYDGPGTSRSEAYDMAVDGAGNIYVTGSSRGGSGLDEDYITIKYDPSGAEQWVVSHINPMGEDRATAIAIDGEGNVYVTGSAYTSQETGSDYVTIKYNALGVEQWIARYNGTQSGGDYANAIGVDNSGNVYVTGYNYGTDGYATVKYNASGVEQWVVNYEYYYDEDVPHPRRTLAVDDVGNVYVTMFAGPNGDYVTSKYDASGAEVWVARYNGPGNSTDWPSTLAIDDAGNVYVTGSSYSATTGTDYATIKYDASGAEQWVVRHNGPGNSWDTAYALTVDVAGNVYVTGQSVDTRTDPARPTWTYMDYATIKYDSTGIEQWTVRYNGPGNSEDSGNAIAVDTTGNVYVTGYTFGSGTETDYATIKYDASGSEQWVALYNGPGNSVDWPVGLDVDISGNVYVAGTSSSEWGGPVWSIFCTIKYTDAAPTLVSNEREPRPRNFSLTQNYPNPFNPGTEIPFQLPQRGFVELRIFNSLGQEVRTLAHREFEAGYHTLRWDGKNGHGQDVASGVYVYVLITGKFRQIKKMMLIR